VASNKFFRNEMIKNSYTHSCLILHNIENEQEKRLTFICIWLPMNVFKSQINVL